MVAYFIIELGNHKIIFGKAIKRAMQTIMAPRNGQIPRKMVYIGISLTIPSITYTTMPEMLKCYHLDRS
jgi:hypothetical protein